jgi:hypothetical protein
MHEKPVRFCIHKYSFDAFLGHSGLKEGILYLHWFLIFISMKCLHTHTTYFVHLAGHNSKIYSLVFSIYNGVYFK